MGDMIPEGRYKGVAVRTTDEDGNQCLARWGLAGKDQSRERKSRQVLMYFEILEEGPYKGLHLPWFGYFTKASYERTMQSLRYCGWRGDDLMDIENQAMDQIVSITVGHNNYEGKVYPRVDWVNRVGGGSVIALNDPMSESDARQFAAQMRSYASQIAAVDSERVDCGAKAGSTSNADGAASVDNWGDDGPPPSDDDIPF
jgi:hypothetical protein